MKALVWHKQGKLLVEDFPMPKPPGPNEVTLKIDWCGICGTDVEEYTHGPMYIPVDTPNPLTGAKAPLVMGHEMVGTVVEVGKNVTSLKPGDIVAPDPIIFCRTCPNCETHNMHHCDNMAHLGLTTHGGCAEYVNTLAEVCFKLPADMPSEVGALSEPASVCVRAVRKAQIQEGQSVVIIGGGTIGLLTLQMVKLTGASPIIMIEPQPDKRALAQKLGADVLIDPKTVDAKEEVFKLTKDRGADRVIECGGNEITISLAPTLARKRGRVLMTGLHNAPVGMNTFQIVWHEIEVIGSFSHVYDIDFKQAVDWIGQGKLSIDPLVTSKINLDNAVSQGFEELIHNGQKHIKILITPHLV